MFIDLQWRTKDFNEKGTKMNWIKSLTGEKTVLLFDFLHRPTLFVCINSEKIFIHNLELLHNNIWSDHIFFSKCLCHFSCILVSFRL